MPQKNLNDCAEPSDEQRRNLDPHPVPCDTDKENFEACDGIESKFHNETIQQVLDSDSIFKDGQLGQPIFCDPMQTGQIVDDPKTGELPPDKSVIYKYSRGLRAADMATQGLFERVNVIDDQGQVMRVPIIWGSQEKAVEVILSKNVRKDITGVVDRIVLPMMSIYTSSYDFARERYIYHKAIDYKRLHGQTSVDNKGNPVGSRAGPPGLTHKERHSRDTVLGLARGIPIDLGYTLTIWTRFWEDMNQILEQITLKFSPVAYIRIQGVTNWETTVEIDGIANNLDMEPGDKNIRIFKFQVSLTTKTFIPQPIVRRKAVLKTKIDILDGISDDDIGCVLSKIENAVGELDV